MDYVPRLGVARKMELVDLDDDLDALRKERGFRLERLRLGCVGLD